MKRSQSCKIPQNVLVTSGHVGFPGLTPMHSFSALHQADKQDWLILFQISFQPQTILKGEMPCVLDILKKHQTFGCQISFSQQIHPFHQMMFSGYYL